MTKKELQRAGHRMPSPLESAREVVAAVNVFLCRQVWRSLFFRTSDKYVLNMEHHWLSLELFNPSMRFTSKTASGDLEASTADEFANVHPWSKNFFHPKNPKPCPSTKICSRKSTSLKKNILLKSMRDPYPPEIVRTTFT